ncbi:hypothetical protein MARA_08470 [Mycolicibacterium arabiense]|uniref:Uncharacterized protein n=1 Tax=Mycolicibacterium arabiense TaxID=1286181 RepID=A0A7I7RTW0_9MYCO|nr:hypothetical protein [Mycolicibacterium arabiense]MCV7375956.1 hypothetical protein [Mycolicibacterium arabiense]BBY47379.1 hypothetical protein MARA_08470 [Mycolicibacterium arabiense]
MQNNKIRGPVITLAAVAVLGGGLWWANADQDTGTAPAPSAAAVTAPAPSATPSAAPPAAPPPVQFPASADYVGRVPTKAETIELDIAVDGATGTAYVCDGAAIEVWLRGSATDGALALANPDESSRIQAKLVGDDLAGTLFIGERKWDFTAARKAVA